MLHSILKLTAMVLLMTVILPGWGHTADDKVESCLAKLTPLKKKKDFVNERGSIWSLFQQSTALSDHSGAAVQLDSKINELLWVSRYLCETLDGVPPNDLALYVTKNIKAKGKEPFKKELKVLGISEGEIKEWFQFSDFSRAHLNRKLNADSVEQSIQHADTYLLRYKELAQQLERAPKQEHLQHAVDLTRDIDSLESDDTNLAQGLWEIHQVPRWDYDGSVGGS